MSDIVTCDVECYPNYFLVMFYHVSTGRHLYIDMLDNSTFDRSKLARMLTEYTIVTYNGNNYDLPLICMFLCGASNEKLKKTSDAIIAGDIKSYDILRSYQDIIIDTIDIMNVCPLKATLKIYGGRIHTETMQDLPLEPDTVILADQLPAIRKYCLNDVRITAELYQEVKFNIDIRIQMGSEIGLDLRSKGDASIAETIITKRIGSTVRPPQIPAGTQYKYAAPAYISFKTTELKEVMVVYTSLPYTVMASGHIDFTFPDGKKSHKLQFYDTTYTIGIGGLHSCEKQICHESNSEMILEDNDVTSYYPNIILNNEYYPESLGKVFYEVYHDIVDERIAAKHSGDKIKAQALKIPINASFGKFGSKYSKLYAPNLMINVTITGQLSLLMLIEKLEMNGIRVVSANTDGIVTYYPRKLKPIKDSIISDWSKITNYAMEVVEYKVLASRDVNNYIAVKHDGTCKGKGAYADLNEEYYHLRSNPDAAICYTACRKFLSEHIPVEDSIMQCKDIRQFVTIRTVTGGAMYDNVLIGKSIRYYHSCDSLECFFYSDKIPTTAGHKVPDTDGTVPCMKLPEVFPADIDYSWYINKANKVLSELGV